MFAFFLLPASMAIGGALVSAPIIIHLINRMRFRRVRWAAMEFLLKSQKRNRRRLIIEQLLLLLLRCLLFVMIAFLLARFTGCTGSGADAKTTFHVVVLDDTLSMKDTWTDQGVKKNCLDQAQDLVMDVATKANKRGGMQHIHVIRMSRPKDAPVFDAPLSDEQLSKLKTALDRFKIDKFAFSDLHANPKEALAAAQDFFNQHPQGQRLLYLVSDFRSADWTGPQADALTGPNGIIDGLLRAKVPIELIDTADPARDENGLASGHHDNIGIVDLQSESRVAAKESDIKMTATVHNFTGAELRNIRLAIKVNGQERHDLDAFIPRLPAHADQTHTFKVRFNETGYNLISATLPGMEVGLQPDDTRFAVVEVRDHIETLVISGDAGKAEEGKGEAYFLKQVFELERGHQIVNTGVDALEKLNLDYYPYIFLVNVPELPSERALKNLESYVRQGGSLAVFLGNQVLPSYYNEKMYAGGKGLVPVKLGESPHVERWSEQQKQEKRQADQEYLFIRQPRHPVFADTYPYRQLFKGLLLWGYWETEPREQWQRDNRLEEWATLANDKPMTVYQRRGNELVAALDLPEDKYKKYIPGLKYHQSLLREKLGGKSLGALADALEKMLGDVGEENNPARPNLKELFELPEFQTLRQEIEAFREEIQYGPPLILQHRLGQGRVVTFLTGADGRWSDWPNGPAAHTYVMTMLELRRFLGGSETFNRAVGMPVHLELDPSRYTPTVEVYFQAEPKQMRQPQPGQPDAQPQAVGTQGGKIKVADLTCEEVDGQYRATFADTDQPGAYHFVRTLQRFKLTEQSFLLMRSTDKMPDDVLAKLERLKNQEFPKEFEFFQAVEKELGTADTQQFRSKLLERAKTGADPLTVVFNVDTTAEGDLRRARHEDLVRNNPPTPSPDRAVISMRGVKEGSGITTASLTDTSESPWLFLALLIVLIIEQALAVHLSFHLRGNEAQQAAAVPAPQAA